VANKQEDGHYIVDSHRAIKLENKRNDCMAVVME
jgi:hypothetical protein